MIDLPQGWLTPPEAKELQRLAQDRVVLELGAWKGRSTVAMAEVARYVISVDDHTPINADHPEDSLDEYLAAVRGLPNVGIVVARFEDFCPFLRAVDMIYVDGNHDFLSVEHDALVGRNALEVVAFHDWDIPDVERAVLGVFGRKPDALVGSVASYKVGR